MAFEGLEHLESGLWQIEALSNMRVRRIFRRDSFEFNFSLLSGLDNTPSLAFLIFGLIYIFAEHSSHSARLFLLFLFFFLFILNQLR